MQVWSNKNLTLKIPLKFVNYEQTCKFVKTCIDTQYSTNSNMNFSIKFNILMFSILIQQLISNQNNIKRLIKQFN